MSHARRGGQRRGPRLGWNRLRLLLAFALVATLIVGYIAVLLTANYSAQVKLRDSNLDELRRDAEGLAARADRFFHERSDDVRRLAARPELAVYFASRALGMSMRYGLQASLLAIDRALRELLNDRGLGGPPIYRRLAFIAEDGEPLVDTHPGEWPLPQRRALLTPGKVDPSFVSSATDEQHTLVTMPYYYKQKHTGQLVAWVDLAPLRRHLAADDHTHVCIDRAPTDDCVAARPPFGSATARWSPRRAPGQAVEELVAVTHGGTKEDLLAVRIPLQGTPFRLVTVARASRVKGELEPGGILLAMGGVAVVLLAAAWLLVRTIAQNLLLAARLDESHKRETEVAEKNLALLQEIESRHRAEAALRESETALRRYQAELEDLIATRTEALAATQKQLVAKAMEAGRAQLGAMVLHNIGNAVTPLRSHVDAIATQRLRQVVDYLDKCYSDLRDHHGDLHVYVTADPRGRQVFAYAHALTAALRQCCDAVDENLTQLNLALGHVSDLLRLQQTYATREKDTKEWASLNQLIDDVLQMQRGLIGRHGIRVERRYAPDLPRLLVDRNRLAQVFINVIKNSCEAIAALPRPAGGSITIVTLAGDGRVGCEVTDTGVGIEGGALSIAFGRSTKGSSGFGLYYCKMFVEAQGGELLVHSPGKEKGATVSISFQHKESKLPADGAPA